jgi:hypothetical protein
MSGALPFQNLKPVGVHVFLLLAVFLKLKRNYFMAGHKVCQMLAHVFSTREYYQNMPAQKHRNGVSCAVSNAITTHGHSMSCSTQFSKLKIEMFNVIWREEGV